MKNRFSMRNILACASILFFSQIGLSQTHDHHGMGTHSSEQMAHLEHVAPASGAPSHDDMMAGMAMNRPYHDRAVRFADCSSMEAWSYSSGMCEVRALPGMPMKMIMLHGNVFGVQNFSEGPRGRNAFSSPNMFMADIGSTVGNNHYVNLNLMTTLERWTFPESGYPLTLQIGEVNAAGEPYIDAQHPHSSPIMGLTLSDRISFGSGQDHLRLFVAPRGEATEGPTAFMHRPIGVLIPDAPLGHHVGQDVSHISSSVVGASLRVKKTTYEFSAFNGTEPEPSKVDLPVAMPNSYAGRLIHQVSDEVAAMASASYVQDDGHHGGSGGGLEHMWRYSGSVYYDESLLQSWSIHHALVYGLINFYDHTSALTSGLYEFWLNHSRQNFWARFEVLQRTPEQLAVELPAGAAAGAGDEPLWVQHYTLGYTHNLDSIRNADLNVGVSITKDILPAELRGAYGGDPWTSRIFVQAAGMKMLGW